MSQSGYEEQREHELHAANLQGANGRHDDTQAIQYVAEPEDIDPVDGLEWINSKAASTTKFTREDIISNEWVREYFQLLVRMQRPPEYGVHGWLRVFATENREEYVEPATTAHALEIEGQTELSKEIMHRSDEGFALKETLRNRSESYVHKDDEQGKKGLRGRIFG